MVEVQGERRADAYFGLKQYDKAVSDYTEAIRVQVGNTESVFSSSLTDTYERRANAYDKLGGYSKAEEDRKKAKELRDKH
jgi:tetratricopeptide (TPR) repeat protein